MDGKLSILISTILLLCVTSLGTAQQAEVEGTVTDSQSDEVLPGVNVLVKGTTMGTTTNADGDYSLPVPSLTDTLVFSYIGYETREVPIEGQTAIDIALEFQTVRGDEIVVVGYGEQERTEITGSISSITNEDITKSPAANVGNSLAGKIPGLQSIQASGQPGGDRPRVFLRGIGSLTTGRSEPILVVDGIERDVFRLEPENIESLSVLKDASATAVYGVRGANGVIVVETKRGKEGPIQISAKFSSGFQQPTNIPEFVDSYTYSRMYNEAQLNDGVSSDRLRFSEKAIEAFRTNSHPLIYPDMDWVDYLTNPSAFQTRSNLSLSGGTEAVKYFVSGSYLNQDGIFKTFDSDYDFNHSFQKYNFRTNLDIDATPSTRVSLTGYGRLESRIRTRGGANANRFLWRTIYRGPPFSSAGVVDGKLVNHGTSRFYIPGPQLDPVRQFYGNGYNQHDNNLLHVDLSIRQGLDFITEGLAFEMKGSYNTLFEQNKYRNSTKATYVPYFRTDVDPSASGDSTIVFQKTGRDGVLDYGENYGRDRDWYVEARLNFNRDFGPHKVGGLLLYNQRKNFYPNQYRGIPRGLINTVGRGNYNYDDRYLLEVNIGYSGSENFAEGNRFGFFPSVSGGWIVTNEEFMENVDFLNHLKFRASYGVVGNDGGIGRFLYLPDTYNASAPGYNFGYEVPQNSRGAAEDQLGNPDVQWETAAKQNYGVNIGLVDGRLRLNLDYFYEYRNKILTTLNTVPAYVASDLPAVNVGEVENQGYEGEVKWRHQLGDFAYRINANLTFARNEVLYMDEVPRNEPYLRRTGHPVNQKFGYIFDGFFSEADLEEGSSVPDHPYPAQPGDLKFKDLNEDGVVNTDDQRAIGYPLQYPEYSFGGEIGFRYKNFDLTTVWAGAANTSRLMRFEPYRSAFGPRGQWSMMQWQADNRWTPENAENATYPRLSIDAIQRRNNMHSDFWMRDASYLRLKNAEIGYNFSSEFLNKVGLRNLRMYVKGYNLLTFTKLKMIDPEQSGLPFNALYPVMKVYNFGVNIDF